MLAVGIFKPSQSEIRVCGIKQGCQNPQHSDSDSRDIATSTNSFALENMDSKLLVIFFLATCVLLSCFNEVEGFVDKRINDIRKRKKAKRMLKKELRLARKTAKEMKLVQRYLQSAMAWGQSS